MNSIISDDYKMRIGYKEYAVDIEDDRTYILDAKDNLSVYDKVYFDHGEYQSISKHGIKVSKDGQHISSVIICGYGGATGIYDNSFLLLKDVLFVCCSNIVYSFRLPDLVLNWKREFDSVVCFALYPFKEDIIIHGESSIKRIDIKGNVKWDFSAKDIFVTQNGSVAVEIKGDKIKVADWEGYKYVLNENGQLIK